MYYQYPLETLARAKRAASQLDFARRAKAALSDTDELLSRPVGRGLALFAANEAALEEPARILHDLYGDFLEIQEPTARLIPGEPPQEPVMHVRIASRLEHAAAIEAEVRRRGGRVDEQCVRGRTFVLRGEAPLARLLGLPAALEAITGGHAEAAIRLVRYAPVRPDPEAA
jgi:hypothetical protein